jgi:predicted phosphodiesterase
MNKSNNKIAAGVSKIKKEHEKKESSKKMLNAIEQMISKKGIDFDSIGSIDRISLYQTVTKDEEGNTEIHDLQAVQLSPTWDSGPQWKLPEQGPLLQIQKSTVTPKKNTSLKMALIVPDIQFGYYRDRDLNLVPTHDERAIAIVLAIAKRYQPDQIICLGDNLDLPEMSKYRLSPAFANTTQASIDRATTFCAEMREAVPHAKIVWLAGNHEERLTNYLLDNAKAAFGISRGNTPEGWPDLSVPNLLRMDEYGVQYLDGYPTGYYLINEQLACIHGDKVRSNGSTAHMYLNAEKMSVIYGHIHRNEMAYKTRRDHDGPRTIMAASPGTLARVDGAVPSTKGGIDVYGRPKTVVENWQQGFALVHFQETGKQFFNYEPALIYDGWCVFRGEEFDGRKSKAPTLKPVK